MAALYSPEGHVLLSEAAQALDIPQLDAYAEAAERELGLRGTDFTDEDAETATLAVVYAINCALARGEGGQAVESESKGDQSVKFAFSRIGSGGEDFCTKARDLAAGLLAKVAVQEPAATAPRSATIENSVVW